jgi:zinc transport system substrate-binding protein
LLPSRPAGVWIQSDHGDGDDPHVWLDPRNAQAIVRAVVQVLSGADPAHGVTYAANGAKAARDLVRLEADLLGRLAPVAERPYVVFHDAFGYFEHRFGLHPMGAVTSTPDRRPGARRLAQLRRTMAETGAGCVFVEPQVKPALAETLVRGTGARLAALDPMGAGLDPGPMLYENLMVNLAESLLGCLTKAG